MEKQKKKGKKKKHLLHKSEATSAEEGEDQGSGC